MVFNQCCGSEVIILDPNFFTPDPHQRIFKQGCEFGSQLDPDPIGSVDPYSESGSRRAKMTHKSRKFF